MGQKIKLLNNRNFLMQKSNGLPEFPSNSYDTEAKVNGG